VPQVYSSFELEGNYYLVTEFIEGHNLQMWLKARRRRIAVASAIRYALHLSTIISHIHAAGWVWRDCKPANLIVTKTGTLRPLDFEGACLAKQPDPVSWGTPPFVPPESYKAGLVQSKISQDLYALGAVIYLLLTGTTPQLSAITPLEKLRRNVPSAIRRLVSALLDSDPQHRPDARAVARRLRASLHSTKLATETAQ
jgi:serine/threonine protein kinase